MKGVGTREWGNCRDECRILPVIFRGRQENQRKKLGSEQPARTLVTDREHLDL